MKKIAFSLIFFFAFSVYAAHPRCVGNPQPDKCEELERRLATESAEDKKKRQNELEKSRQAAMNAVNQAPVDAVKQTKPTENGMVSMKTLQFKGGGFGSVAIVNLQVTNGTPQQIKDIQLKCEYYAPSGTKLDVIKQTLFDTVKPNSVRIFQDFNLGFMPNQANRISCEILGYKNR